MNNYGITRSELHPSLVNFIQSTGISVKFMKSSHTLSNSTKEVPIGINTFNKDRDLLLVYKNSIYLEIVEDYTISSDGSKIISVDEKFSTGSMFNFIIFTNCAEFTEGIDGTKLLDNSIGISKLDNALIEKINGISSGGGNMDIDGGLFGEVQSGNMVDGGEF